jgi:hypothetical protein
MSATVAAITAYYGNNVWPQVGIADELENQNMLMMMPFYHVSTRF